MGALVQAQQLGKISLAMQDPKCSPLAALYDALNTAVDFVHVVATKIGNEPLGALKLISRKVPVRILLAGPLSAVDVTDPGCIREARELTLRVEPTAEPASAWAPWTAVVVDGLLAFEGNAPLESSEWKEGGVVKAVTDAEAVSFLHDFAFARHWAHGSYLGSHIDTSLPF